MNIFYIHVDTLFTYLDLPIYVHSDINPTAPSSFPLPHTAQNPYSNTHQYQQSQPAPAAPDSGERWTMIDRGMNRGTEWLTEPLWSSHNRPRFRYPGGVGPSEGLGTTAVSVNDGYVAYRDAYRDSYGYPNLNPSPVAQDPARYATNAINPIPFHLNLVNNPVIPAKREPSRGIEQYQYTDRPLDQQRFAVGQGEGSVRASSNAHAMTTGLTSSGLGPHVLSAGEECLRGLSKEYPVCESPSKRHKREHWMNTFRAGGELG
eukprot:393672-Amorphochlora_amoeboformis.AAC.1